jgi:hypothetical protein
MDRVYDLFEKLPDGSLVWRETVVGHEAAIAKLKDLAAKTSNECCVMYLVDKALIATLKKKRP